MQPLTDRTMRIVERLFRREDHDLACEVPKA
jgi:hypothetical protein